MTSELLARLDLADSLPGAADLREATYELLRCGPGDRVLDVGCGGGRAVAELCARGVRAVGADLDPRMPAVARARSAGGPVAAGGPAPGVPAPVLAARARSDGDRPTADAPTVSASALAARSRGSSPPAEFVEADVLRLPFADGEFRGYRADKVLHELADPAAAVAEARRVLAPGGRVVLCGQDWDTLVLDSDRPALTRAIVHARADTVAGPRAARQYRTLLVDAGFTEVAVEVRTVVDTDGGFRPLLDGLAAAARDAGVATDAQLEAWLREQAARAEAGRFFLAVPIFVASATKSPQ